jgi:transposase
MYSLSVAFSVLTDDFRTVVRGTRTFSNTSKGFALFQTWVSDKKQLASEVHFTMEATGVYHEELVYFLHEKGYLVHIVLPNVAKKYGQSLGLKSKTDKLDARTLAQMGLERELRLWKPLSSSMLVLKQLTRERDALVCTRTIFANRLHAYRHQGRPFQDSITRSMDLIFSLDEQIKKIEKEVKNLVDADNVLKTKMEYLVSIPGVGLLTAAIIAAETDGFVTFTSIKQLTGYAGLYVRIAESGTWKGKSKISKRGNSRISAGSITIFAKRFICQRLPKLPRKKEPKSSTTRSRRKRAKAKARSLWLP